MQRVRRVQKTSEPKLYNVPKFVLALVIRYDGKSVSKNLPELLGAQVMLLKILAMERVGPSERRVTRQRENNELH
jgi:hypothetical protein